MENNKEKGSGGELKAARCNIRGREFIIQILQMKNGCFASLSEDRVPRIGTIAISVKSDKKSAQTSSLIPDRKGGMLANMVGEMLASKYGGIAITSLYLREEVDAESMKTLINEVSRLSEKDLTGSS